jgi:hypothetical protein
MVCTPSVKAPRNPEAGFQVGGASSFAGFGSPETASSTRETTPSSITAMTSFFRAFFPCFLRVVRTFVGA